MPAQTRMDNLGQALLAALRQPSLHDEVPAGFLSEADMSEFTGIARSTLRRLLTEMVSDGRAERRMFRIRSGNSIKPVSHFRLIDARRR